MTRFIVRRAAEAEYVDAGPLAPGSVGMTRWRGVGEDDGAAHTDFGITRLAAGGRTATHVHSFEESFYVIEGEVVIATPEATVRLVAGDYGVIPIGVPHAWRSTGSDAAWADLFTPPARARHGSDTYRVEELAEREPTAVDTRDPRTRSFGNITTEHMDAGRQSQQLLAVSASMRTALLVYSGITLKMMVDSDLGATLGTSFMVRYAPDGKAGPHDHPLEEAYLITEGEVRAHFDGQEFLLTAGDIAWAGVGCVHSFEATGAEVQWLETQSPQMPPRHAYRFVRDWQYLEERLEEKL
ncbi:cupin domain-containing protein [Microbacterium sp. zg-Y818]|uniref:cupin domain-containing protein n=1 Tax=unclassified Microbacterium TaxID=2609290 RepID=UPI00214B1BBF|nr:MULTISPECIES: cupin domain-containing protein [unclassified Microbacterium]MCR2799570.1 cupin domain-containing protein [Microbacterium sp. zg.Y818]WIM21564.1 cupin domain-containing protein [Microbacterium sp. zg-Y818]